MQADRRKGECEQTQVLDDKCVYTNTIERPRHLYRFGILFLVQQGVERNQYLHAIGVGIMHQRLQVVKTIPRCLPRTKARSTDIDGVRARLDSGFGDTEVASRRE